MTAVTRDASTPHTRFRINLRELVRSREGESPWALPALLGVTGLAIALYIWNLSISGYANTYYSAAALAASKSWSAFFFGSFDPANFITVDKPPLAIMVMGLSVRLFGLSSWSILLPQALEGALTVAILFLAVRRSFGPLAALIAGLVMALTPAAVLIFRFNNPDALLVLLLVAAAWALLHALDDGSLRWTAVAAAFVGLAFLTKYLQAYLVLPGFALVYGFTADTTLRRRVTGLFAAAITVVVTSGWWVAVVQLIPAASRPFIGGSTTGSPLDLIFGYDGLGRLFGRTGPGGGVGGFGGTAGLFRLFNADFFGEIAWLLPLALALLLLGIWLRRHAPATDRGFAGYLLWGSWFVMTAAVFSFMSGVIHSYYAVALAPAVAALVGAGVADLWARRSRGWLAPAALGLAFVASAWWGWQLLSRTPDFAPFVGPLAVVLAATAAAVLLLGSVPRLSPVLGRFSGPALALGLSALLLAPAAYASATLGTSYGGGDPHPGPGAAGTRFGAAGHPGAFGGPADGGSGVPFGGGTLPAPAGTFGLPGGGGADSALASTALDSYLVAHRGSATWIVAINSAQDAGSIELATGLPVMAMGGFTGSDPVPTLAQLQQYIASGRLRYVIVGGAGGFGGPGGFDSLSSERIAWVTSACKVVDDAGSGRRSLYDCAGAAT